MQATELLGRSKKKKSLPVDMIYSMRPYLLRRIDVTQMAGLGYSIRRDME